jgi:polar amino acid transport system substrate-binding protein
VQRGSVSLDLLEDTIDPDDDPILFDNAVDCVEAVATGEADAALMDLSTALVLTNGRDDVTVGARLILDQQIAIALPSGSPNVEAVDAGLRAMVADGTLADLDAQWLEPAFGTDPDSIPIVRAQL